MVQKGTVVNILPGGVRIKPDGSGNAVTPVIKSNIELALNDVVAFVMFDDGTGVIIQKM